MRGFEAGQWRSSVTRVGLLTVVFLALTAHAQVPADAAAEQAWRYRAPVSIERAAPLLRLPLPLSAYAASEGRVDELRVVDARGDRIPFAWLDTPPDGAGAAPGSGAPAVLADRDVWRSVSLYRLPPPAAPGHEGRLPVEVQLQAGRVIIRTLPGTAESGRAAPSAAPSPGWLFDMGEGFEERLPGEAAALPSTLRLRWTGPAEFAAAFTLEHSADLREWRSAGGGQVMALAGGSGVLSQPDIALPTRAERFVRLRWANPAEAPLLTAAQAAWPKPPAPGAQALTEVTVSALRDAAGASASADEKAVAAQSLVFDLGASLPLHSLALQWPEGGASRVWPAQLQWRDRAEEPWQSAMATVFYQLEREGSVQRPAPLRWSGQARYLRIVVDQRAGQPYPEGVRLVARAAFASTVLVAQGTPPYALLAGPVPGGTRMDRAGGASGGALPLATLMPDPASDRQRLGLAQVGAFAEQPLAVEQARAASRDAAWRPWLLWALLLAGVAGLGVMVWRLARRGGGRGEARGET
jgi:Protein of unknown function (DUF3999)